MPQDRFVKAGKDVIIRFPLIPGITDTADNIAGISEFLSSLENDYPVNLLPYHRTAGAKYERLGIPDMMTGMQPPTAEMMNDVRARFAELGIEVREGE